MHIEDMTIFQYSWKKPIILVITEIEAESIFHSLIIRLENYLCQFSDSYLEACRRNSRKTQPAMFALPPWPCKKWFQRKHSIESSLKVHFSWVWNWASCSSAGVKRSGRLTPRLTFGRQTNDGSGVNDQWMCVCLALSRRIWKVRVSALPVFCLPNLPYLWWAYVRRGKKDPLEQKRLDNQRWPPA